MSADTVESAITQQVPNFVEPATEEEIVDDSPNDEEPKKAKVTKEPASESPIRLSDSDESDYQPIVKKRGKTQKPTRKDLESSEEYSTAQEGSSEEEKIGGKKTDNDDSDKTIIGVVEADDTLEDLFDKPTQNAATHEAPETLELMKTPKSVKRAVVTKSGEKKEEEETPLRYIKIKITGGGEPMRACAFS